MILIALHSILNLFRYMKQLLFFLFVFFIVGKSSGQDKVQAVINATGNTYTQNNGIIFEWSVGELAVVETMIVKQVVITNGLLQPVLPSQFITEGFTVLATNILSPNGDGKNDTWVVKDIERYPDNEVTVFDRSGQVVFQTKNYKNNWTGHLSGTQLVEGTYYYIIKLNKGGKTGLIKGYITVLN